MYLVFLKINMLLSIVCWFSDIDAEFGKNDYDSIPVTAIIRGFE
jgi:hypothetical protein